jgi:hypothetical protein
LLRFYSNPYSGERFPPARTKRADPQGVMREIDRRSAGGKIGGCRPAATALPQSSSIAW